jgi:hypothetical protein
VSGIYEISYLEIHNRNLEMLPKLEEFLNPEALSQVTPEEVPGLAYRWNKRYLFISPRIAKISVTPLESDKSRYVNFPAYSKAIREGFYYGSPVSP